MFLVLKFLRRNLYWRYTPYMHYAMHCVGICQAMNYLTEEICLWALYGQWTHVVTSDTMPKPMTFTCQVYGKNNFSTIVNKLQLWNCFSFRMWICLFFVTCLQHFHTLCLEHSFRISKLGHMSEVRSFYKPALNQWESSMQQVLWDNFQKNLSIHCPSIFTLSMLKPIQKVK